MIVVVWWSILEVGWSVVGCRCGKQRASVVCVVVWLSGVGAMSVGRSPRCVHFKKD